MPGYNDELEPYTFDLDKAEEELNKADYSIDEINNAGIEFAFDATSSSVQRPIALSMKDNLSKIGITNVELGALQWPQTVQRAENVDTTPNMHELWVSASFPSPDSFTYGMFHPDSFGSWRSLPWFTTDELQSTIEEARTSTSEDEALELYKEAQQMIHEGAPGAFIGNLFTRVIVNNNLNGWQFRGISGYDLRWNTMTRTGDGRA
jgi:peptide/nickel transport system substrate-binding protein